MWISCLLSAVGLVLLSYASKPVLAVLAATVWGTGVCYKWPTVYAIASEQFPKGGDFPMGPIGMAGCLSIYTVLPQIGRVFDRVNLAEAGGREAFTGRAGPEGRLPAGPHRQGVKGASPGEAAREGRAPP